MPLARAILDPETLPVLGRRWDLATLGLLAALFAFAPAAFGAVDAGSEMIVVGFATALALVVAIRPAFDSGFRLARTWTYLPLVLFVALVAVQLVPLPVGLAKLIAPNNVATKAELLGAAAPSTVTISFYPRATVEHLRLVLVGVVVFVTVAGTFRRSKQIKELLLVIFAVGCVEAVVAVAQIATGATHIYWYFPTGRNSVVTSGSFINYSHFCQFMNLSLGAGIGLLLVQLYEQRTRTFSTSFRSHELVGFNWEKHGWILCGIILCAVTVFTSMSRNGVISLLLAATIVGTALYRRGSLTWQGWLLGLLPLGVLMTLFLFGIDAVYDRLATLRAGQALESRWDMTAATLRAWLTYPLWGTGLGTHQFVFPMFDTTVTPVVAEHADNDYAQLLEETGIAGAPLVAAFVIGVGTLAAKLMVRGRTAVSAAAYGLVFGLVAVSIHSATDFGQRLPANLVLSATYCGLIVALSRIEARDRRVRHGQIEAAPPDNSTVRRVASIASLAAVLLIAAWALKDSNAAFLGERWWAGALAMDGYIQKNPAQADDQDYVDLLAAAQNASESDPTNVIYGYWLNAYRWQAMSRTVDPNARQVTLPPEAAPFVGRIADDLVRVRQLCPTYGPPYALEGQLQLFVLNEQNGAELIRKGLRLAPYDAATCLVAGELAAREGDLHQAETLLARAVELRYSYFRDAVSIYLLDVKRPDLARELAGDDYWRLSELANVCAQNADYADLVEDLQTRATGSLRRHASTGTVRPFELATLARTDQEQGDLKSAIGLYRRALAQEYNQVDWRLNLARALAADGQFKEAEHELRVCLRLRPQFGPAIALLQELSVRVPAK